MKFLIAFAAIVAVATSAVIKPVGGQMSELEAIVAAINSPSTDPATAALLEQQLLEIIGSPISVGPAVVDEFTPIAVGPAFVEEESPIAVGPAFVEATPVGAVEVPTGTPLVQILLNAPPGVVSVIPDVATEPQGIVPTPVSVVESAPEPVFVPQPVVVGTPILPAPAMVLPEILNR